MMASDLFVVGVAMAWGGILATLFFGGLWWTLQAIHRVRHRGRFLAASFLVRALMASGGFWLALNHSVPAFLGSVAAFVLMRFVVVRHLGPAKGGGEIGAH